MKFAKAIFGNTDFLTAQPFVFSRDNFFNQPDNKVILACIISGIGEDLFNKIRQTGIDLEDKFFESDLIVTERLKELLDFITNSIQGAENLQAQIVFWQGNVLYIQSLGEQQQAFILREGQIIDLTSSDGKLVSGYIKPGDRLLLLSPRFEVDKTQLKENLEKPDVSESNTPTVLDEQKDPLSFWDKKFIDSLVHSATDALSDTIESLLITPTGGIEPVAAILIDNQLEQDFQKEQQLSNASSPLTSSKPRLPIPKFNFLSKLKIILSVFKNLFRFFLSSRKKTVVGALFILFLLITAGLLTKQISQKNDQNLKINSLLSQSKSDFALAQSQKDTNPEEAKNNLSKAKYNLDQALSIQPDNKTIKDFQNNLEKATADILKIYKVENFPVFISLDLIKPGFSPKKMSYSLGQLLLLDNTQKTLISLDLSNKTHQILAGQNQLGDAKFASINGENIYAFSPDKGISKITLSEKKPQTVIKPDNDWGNISDIYAFSNNLYLLDSLKNKIYKYISIKNGLSDKIDYLKDGTQPNFGSAHRLQIDYSLWVLKKGPEILKFTAGVEDHFAVGGLDTPILSNVPSFFVPEDIDKLYVLDSENSRVVLLKKTGQYLEQYTGDKFKTATDLIVDEKAKKMYLLEGNKIYTIDIK